MNFDFVSYVFQGLINEEKELGRLDEQRRKLEEQLIRLQEKQKDTGIRDEDLIIIEEKVFAYSRVIYCNSHRVLAVACFRVPLCSSTRKHLRLNL